jgi:hypothetical protein
MLKPFGRDLQNPTYVRPIEQNEKCLRVERHFNRTFNDRLFTNDLSALRRGEELNRGIADRIGLSINGIIKEREKETEKNDGKKKPIQTRRDR